MGRPFSGLKFRPKFRLPGAALTSRKEPSQGGLVVEPSDLKIGVPALGLGPNPPTLKIYCPYTTAWVASFTVDNLPKKSL
ncbi:fatty-acid--CoA ligase [Corchorus olitorius]|uniref:Fatty-acid--CoA ligase n=1 Tax=Corchorus olitorius TaxID=93759 RepID=A0A1R3K042_9ROSI|nr:fatty-acid--CoA ligase [Corchorus olitorius]